MKELWPGWRLVLERVASLEELNREYSMLDIQDANDALDAWQLAQAEANKPKPKK